MVRRVFVEKKQAFAVKAKELEEEIRSYLGIQTVTGVRVLIRYDVENIGDETFERACQTVFSEPPVDVLYREEFETAPGASVFGVEFLPGQFDQRADSAVQCVQFLNAAEKPVIRTATVYVIEGNVTAEELFAIKSFCINPVYGLPFLVLDKTELEKMPGNLVLDLNLWENQLDRFSKIWV